MAVYNGENYLRPTLEALLAQTFEDFELIISDNASTDNTEAICREFAGRDRRVTYRRNERNMGMSWNYNQLFRLAQGEYFKWADHDDICAPEFIERCVQVLEAHPTVVLCDSIPSDIDEQGHVLEVHDKPLVTDHPSPSQRFYQFLRQQHDLQQISGLMRASALRRTALHEPYPTADFVLLASLLLIGPFHRVREKLFFYRRHAQQTVSLSRFARYPLLEPSKRGRILLPEWEAYWGLVRSVWRIRLMPSDRARCFVYALCWPAWHGNWLLLSKDLARAALLKAGFKDRWSAGSSA